MTKKKVQIPARSWEMVDILQEVKRRMERRIETHSHPGGVCGHVHMYKAETIDKTQAKNSLLNWIDQSLNPHAFVTEWLRFRMSAAQWKSVTEDQKNAYRLAWVDDMIRTVTPTTPRPEKPKRKRVKK